MLTQKELELLEKCQVTEKVNDFYNEAQERLDSILDEVLDDEFEQLLLNEFLEEHPDFKDESEDEVMEAGGSEFIVQKISDVMNYIIGAIINRIKGEDELDAEEGRSIGKEIMSNLNKIFEES